VSYAERSLAGHETYVQQLTNSLMDSVSTESNAFMRLSLPLLPSVTMNW